MILVLCSLIWFIFVCLCGMGLGLGMWLGLVVIFMIWLYGDCGGILRMIVVIFGCGL